MPLTDTQIRTFRTAIAAYAFPTAYFDFRGNAPVHGLTMRQLETRIRGDLVSGDPGRVKDGLSSILYWGYAQMGGMAQVRVDRFRVRVTVSQLLEATQLFGYTPRPSLKDIAEVGLPEYSNVSFVSKVRMFLVPGASGVLDNQIMKIDAVRQDTVLNGIRRGTTIPVTQGNSDAYEAWCERLNDIQRTYGLGQRAVDIERGLFHLVQTNRVREAADLLACA